MAYGLLVNLCLKIQSKNNIFIKKYKYMKQIKHWFSLYHHLDNKYNVKVML